MQEVKIEDVKSNENDEVKENEAHAEEKKELENEILSLQKKFRQ